MSETFAGVTVYAVCKLRLYFIQIEKNHHKHKHSDPGYCPSYQHRARVDSVCGHVHGRSKYSRSDGRPYYKGYQPEDSQRLIFRFVLSHCKISFFFGPQKAILIHLSLILLPFRPKKRPIIKNYYGSFLSVILNLL